MNYHQKIKIDHCNKNNDINFNSEKIKKYILKRQDKPDSLSTKQHNILKELSNSKMVGITKILSQLEIKVAGIIIILFLKNPVALNLFIKI